MKTLVKLGLGAIVVAAALTFSAPKQAVAHPYWAYRPAYPVYARAYYPRRVAYRAYSPRVYRSYYAPAYYAPAPVYYGGYYGGYGCGW